MNSSKINTSKVLLIILGVLVAIVIGFSSKAVGADSMVKFSSNPKSAIETQSREFFEKSSQNFSKTLVNFFVQG